MESIEKPMELNNVQQRQEKDKEFLQENLLTLDEPSLGELCRDRGIKPKDLPPHLQKTVKKAVKFITKHSSVTDNRLDPEVDFIYKCWFATRALRPGDPLFELAEDLTSFDSFVNSYASRISKHTQANFILRINSFINRRISPSRILELYKKGQILWGNQLSKESQGVYQYGGQWISFPFLHEAAPVRYVERGVIEELAKILESEYPTVDLFHGTGSSALEGIGRHKAILSSGRARELKEEIKTGEYAWYRTERQEEDLPVYGHRRVSNSAAYAVVGWFDEFPIVFGLFLW